MSEAEQALNDENEQQLEAAAESVEIVLEGEDQPSSEGVPYGVQKRFKKLTERVTEANNGKTEAERQLEVANQEIALLKMGSKSDKRPTVDDYESIEEFTAAEDEWLSERIEAGVQKGTKAMHQRNQEAAQATQEYDNLRGSITQHYKRAETLQMPNYEELEDVAIDTLGKDFSQQIMAKSQNSALIMGHLGANPAKAEELRQLSVTDPLGAFTRALEIGGRLSIKGKREPAPDPATEVRGGMASQKPSAWAKGATFT